jgi:hypothetical protein
MKKTLLVCIALFICSNLSFGQNSTDTDSLTNALAGMINKMLTTKIEMDIDTTLYPNHSGNMYISNEPKALIMSMLVPQDYETAKEHLEKRESKKNQDIKETGEFEENGKKILYRTGVVKEEGKKFMMEQYVVSVSNEQTIIITGMYEPKGKSTFGGTIRKAAVSARLK